MVLAKKTGKTGAKRHPPAAAPALDTARAVCARLAGMANPAKARILQRFFKTGPGEYGEGDVFLGIQVPALRQVARAARGLPFGETARLLKSEAHEERLVALLILVERYPRAEANERERIYRFYRRHARFINNWDLVDLSAPAIVGAHLDGSGVVEFLALARSSSLWERRIAIVATHHLIRQRRFGPTLAVARLLLGDREDLIHKAVGWMLREVGKRDQSAEETFLRAHAPRMPRTMLRYAIERFPEPLRRSYLRGKEPR